MLRYTVHGMCGGSGACLCDLLSGLTITVTMIKLAGTDLSHWLHCTASMVLLSTKYYVHQRDWIHESWSRCCTVSTAIGLNTSNSRPFRHNHGKVKIWAHWGLSLLSKILAVRSYNKSQRNAQISEIYFWNRTLHISDSFSVHHQESSTVHTAIGICHTGYQDGTSSILIPLASSQHDLCDIYLLLRVQR